MYTMSKIKNLFNVKGDGTYSCAVLSRPIPGKFYFVEFTSGIDHQDIWKNV
jgi:hypothetical protein